ncbi:MAG: hypothetical protein E6099_04395 [Enterobacter sp.]|nr:hypothetical protein [Enterobacter sp.]
MQVPELTDDAVVELAREGGVAYIPKLSGQRTIALSSLNEAQRQRLVWTGQNQAHYADIIVLVPEQEAPESLVELWKKGEGCVCD